MSFSDVLTDVPGRVSVIEHKIILTSEKPVCLKPYRLHLGAGNWLKRKSEIC